MKEIKDFLTLVGAMSLGILIGQRLIRGLSPLPAQQNASEPMATDRLVGRWRKLPWDTKFSEN